MVNLLKFSVTIFCILLTFSGKSNESIVYQEISKNDLKIISIDSEEREAESSLSKYAIDDNPNTYWGTEWKNKAPSHPHQLVIDLGKNYSIKGFKYLPRQNNTENGDVKDYSFSVSYDNSDFTTTSNGSFKRDKSEKTVLFNSSYEGRFVKFTSISEVNGNPWTVVAELGIIAEINSSLYNSFKHTISGKINLPEGFKNSNGINVSIRIHLANITYYKTYSIPAGKNQIEYDLSVPDGEEFSVGYFIENENDLTNEAYFSQGEMVILKTKSEKLKASKDITGVNINIPGKYLISGKVTLPIGFSAPKEGLLIELNAYDHFQGKNYTKNVRMEEGKNSVDFSINFPQSVFEKFKLRYYCGAGGFIRSGFYSKKGLKRFYEMPPEIYFNPEKDRLENITIKLIPDKKALSEPKLAKLGEAKAIEIATKIFKPYYTEFEKFLAAHDYIVDNFEYFSDEIAVKHRLEAFNDMYWNNMPFISNAAVCGSYSDSNSFLLKLIGIESKSMLTREPGYHAWNILKLEDVEYIVDTTLNDSWNNSYVFFLLSDNQFRKLVIDSHLKEWDQDLYKVHNKVFKFKVEDYIHKKDLSSKTYRRIFGTISLPNNSKAEKDGVLINAYNSQFFIPPGENSCTLALKVKTKDFKNGFAIGFNTDKDYAPGFYGSNGQADSIAKSGSFNLDGEDITNVRIVLQKKEP